MVDCIACMPAVGDVAPVSILSHAVDISFSTFLEFFTPTMNLSW